VSRTILIMAAGTGGQIFPGLAIAKELAARGWRIAWMGTPAGMERALVARAGTGRLAIETASREAVRRVRIPRDAIQFLDGNSKEA